MTTPPTPALVIYIRASQSRIFDGTRAPLWPAWAHPGCAVLDTKKEGA